MTIQQDYINRFLLSPQPFFDNVFNKAHAGNANFKDIQDKLEDFSSTVHNELLISKRRQPLKFQNDSGVYHQRVGYEEYDFRYDQFETVMAYSPTQTTISFTQGDQRFEVGMEPNHVYMINNQIEHKLHTDIESKIVMFCFDASYMEMFRWIKQLGKKLK